ncbi:MAG: class I SAM-dependent methyltransferase [Betaproteobacteria bacterium]|nr:MAG: class I SAM-dependent methyltransferase [Betaproteobacteria bacterium]
MTELAERFKERFFGSEEHPYLTFERHVDKYLQPDHTLLDAGCGRTAPVLVKYLGRARRLIGVDLVDFPAPIDGVELLKNDLSAIPIEDGSVDIVMCRSVMEHVVDPLAVYSEMNRILRPKGYFIFLTGNFWDYAALAATIVPNRLHPWIVSKVQGRAPMDVFPTAYKTNTSAAVKKWASATGFQISSFQYLGQYPAYFMFNGFLFLVASAYEKLLRNSERLRFFRGWILVVLRKE